MISILSPLILAPPFGPASGRATTIREAVVAALKADYDFVAIIGDRIYPDWIAQTSPLPACTVSIASSVRGQVLSGHDAVTRSVVQVDLWSRTKSELVAAKEAVEALLDGARGEFSGIEVLWSSQQDEVDRSERADDGSDRHLYRVSLAYLIRHRTS